MVLMTTLRFKKNDHDGVNDDAQVQNNLKGIILDSIEERWFSDGKWGQYPAMLESNGVVSKFVIANGALAAQGIPDGVYTPASIASKLKDIVKEDAMEGWRLHAGLNSLET